MDNSAALDRIGYEAGSRLVRGISQFRREIWQTIVMHEGLWWITRPKTVRYSVESAWNSGVTKILSHQWLPPATLRTIFWPSSAARRDEMISLEDQQHIRDVRKHALWKLKIWMIEAEVQESISHLACQNINEHQSWSAQWSNILPFERGLQGNSGIFHEAPPMEKNRANAELSSCVKQNIPFH